MIDFDYCFKKLTINEPFNLTGNEPFAWQRELFARLARGVFPSECDIPTGLGKTSIIIIWLLALADDLMRQDTQRTIPLRLVYVVDRRVIVDQATSDADGVVKNLKGFAKTDEKLRKVYDALKQAAFSNDNNVTALSTKKADGMEAVSEDTIKDDIDVVALSTLRGEHADNHEWYLDPSRPAIIVGTIDMIGSRLLFSGYGKIGKSYKALQAGLLGQDSLIVVDEAHLSPSFVTLLNGLKLEIEKGATIKPFSLMQLSATLINNQNDVQENLPTREVFRVDETDEDVQNNKTIVHRRFYADKLVVMREFSVDPEKLKGVSAANNFRAAQVSAVVEQAFEYANDSAAILIYAKEVETVKGITKQLEEKLKQSGFADAHKRILTMTGGMRGKERDEITENEIFKKFIPKPNRKKPDSIWYLVATSTAEVGINLDGDHAVCDLTSLDSLTQRIGRVNRFGNNAAQITIVVSPQQVDISQKYFAAVDKSNEASKRFDEASERVELESNKVEEAKAQVVSRKAIIKQSKLEYSQQKANKKSKDEGARLATEKAWELVEEAQLSLTNAKKELAEAKEKLSEVKNESGAVKKERDQIAKELEEISKLYVRPLALSESEIFTYRKLKENELDGKITASPFALKKMSGDDHRCYPLPPICPPLDAARIDDWAMTSVSGKDFPRPQVAAWLRGVIDDETTETNVCWRADLNFAVTDEDALKMISVVPPTSRETARETTVRAREMIKILANYWEEKNRDEKFYIIDSNGEAETYPFRKFVTAKKRSGERVSDGEKKSIEAKLFELLSFSTVVLPCEVGGLKKGLVIDDAKDIQKVDDVADEKTWLRVVFEQVEEGWAAKNLIGEETFGVLIDIDKGIDDVEKEMQKREIAKVCIHQSQAANESSNDDDEIEDVIVTKKRKPFVVYFVARKSPDRFLRDDDIASISMGKVMLEVHNADVESYAQRLAEKLNLSAELREALAIAGKWHDVGKNRPYWQRAIGNDKYPNEILAKSGHNRFNNNFNRGYRHEFGSLIEAEADETLKTHPRRDLILHLIATHHGWARPHFPERAFKMEVQPRPRKLKIAQNTMKRFARLQNEYGWWQLAYLEAVLKAADAMASRDRAGE
jgi:CRISPR-associated endonuclease/helicase Cas3